MLARRPNLTSLNMTYDEVMRMPLSRREAFLKMLANDWKKQTKKI